MIQGRPSPVVQWLKFHLSNGRGVGLIPGWETKILHAKNKQTKKQIQARVERGWETDE